MSTSKLCQLTLDEDNYSFETDENRVIRTVVFPVQSGEKLVIYNGEVEEDFARAVEAGMRA